MYVYLSDEQARLKVLISSYLGGEMFWIAFEKYKISMLIKKIPPTLSIKHTKFSVTLALTSTFQMVQGFS